MARVVFENVTKLFPGPNGRTLRAVDHAGFTVEHGELFVLVGPSACGKTTALRLIAGLEELTDGTISLDGKVMNGVAPKDRDVAMVFQHHALYPHLTAYENMALGLKLRRVPRGEIERLVGDAANLLGLADCLDRRPKALSGGQRQRVALGRALVRRAKVLLLDEPLSNLDAPLRTQMRAEIARLHAQLGATMIYVTHDQVEAMTLGSRIAVMKDGVIQQVDAPLGIYGRPANRFVAGFIGTPPMNFFEGMIVKLAGALGFEIPGPPRFRLRLSGEGASRLIGCEGERVVLGVRPEDIAPVREGADLTSTERVEAVVEFAEAMGAETHLHVVAACGARFTVRAAASSVLRPGETVPLAFNTSRAHFFDPATGRTIVS